MSTKNGIIKKVAIYLRKSRADDEKDGVLSKHRIQLIEYASNNGWSYDIYEENTTTGETLDDRPVVRQLIIDIENKKYDAILVVHYDRLSRGRSSDYGKILASLIFGDTYLVTPDKKYDLSIAADAILLGLE